MFHIAISSVKICYTIRIMSIFEKKCFRTQIALESVTLVW